MRQEVNESMRQTYRLVDLWTKKRRNDDETYKDTI